MLIVEQEVGELLRCEVAHDEGQVFGNGLQERFALEGYAAEVAQHAVKVAQEKEVAQEVDGAHLVAAHFHSQFEVAHPLYAAPAYKGVAGVAAEDERRVEILLLEGFDAGDVGGRKEGFRVAKIFFHKLLKGIDIERDIVFK